MRAPAPALTHSANTAALTHCANTAALTHSANTAEPSPCCVFPPQSNVGGVCVYIEESRKWIEQVNAPSFVTVLPYNYTTEVGEWKTYESMSKETLHKHLFLANLPEYVPVAA